MKFQNVKINIDLKMYLEMSNCLFVSFQDVYNNYIYLIFILHLIYRAWLVIIDLLEFR